MGSADAAPQTQYAVEEQYILQQTGSSSVVAGYSPLGYPEIGFNAKVSTVGGIRLSAAPILAFPYPTSAYPSGYVAFPTGPSFSPTRPSGSGYNNYWVDPGGPSLSAAIGSGTFTFTLGNATAQPTLYLNTVTPSFPATPMLISGGTWNGSTLLLDPASTNTLIFNTGLFTTYTNGAGGWINYQLLNSNGTVIIPKPQSIYIPALGFTNPALTTFTIAPGPMVNGQNYIVQADYNQVLAVNSTPFTGTGITGNPFGASLDTTSTFITVLAQTPMLTSTYAGSQIIVSWPAAVTGWTLQTNNNLVTGTWGNYLGPVSNNSITNSLPAGNLFFRLHHP